MYILDIIGSAFAISRKAYMPPIQNKIPIKALGQFIKMKMKQAQIKPRNRNSSRSAPAISRGRVKERRIGTVIKSCSCFMS